MLGDVRLHVVLGPAGDRGDLDLLPLLVPADHRGVRPGRGLVAAQARRPRGVRGQALFQRLDLAQRAAQVGVPVVQLRPVLGVLLGDALTRGQGDDVDVHHGLDRVTGADGLLEVVARVEEDHVRTGEDPRGQVGDDRVLHGGGHGELLAEGVDRPAQDVQRRGVLQLPARPLGQFFELPGRETHVLTGGHIPSPPADPADPAESD